MNILKTIDKLADVVAFAGTVTGQPEVAAVGKIVGSLIDDETVDTKDYLKGLTDDQIRALIYSAKEELFNRREE